MSPAREQTQENAFQGVLRRTYIQGEFLDADAAGDVDPMFALLLSELATDQDCDSFDCAIGRVENLIRELNAVRTALCNAESQLLRDAPSTS